MTARRSFRGSTTRHLEIIDAMLAGNAEAAQLAAAVHLDEVQAWAIEDFSVINQDTTETTQQYA